MRGGAGIEESLESMGLAGRCSGIGAAEVAVSSIHESPELSDRLTDDPDGRVWGHDNLFVVGNGVVPTALRCNPTLTALALAVRTARAVVRDG